MTFDQALRGRARLGKAGLGKARQGGARQGKAGPGKAWHGKDTRHKGVATPPEPCRFQSKPQCGTMWRKTWGFRRMQKL